MKYYCVGGKSKEANLWA